MVKHSIAALSVVVTMGGAAAMAAGTNPTRTEGPSATASQSGSAAASNRSSSSTTAGAANLAPMGKVEAGKLIGQSVETPTGERIGEVEAVNIGADGRVANVIVGVGGFLGVGERDVALGWKDLQVSSNGGKVVANLSKSRLETMAPYKYADPKHRGTVIEDR